MSRWCLGWRSAAGPLVAACAAAALAGCEGRPAPCLPPEAQALVAPPAAVAGADVGPVDVYIDGSGSMAGFIRGATPGDRPLQDLVTRLPWIAGGLQRPAAFALFGRDLHPLPAGREDVLVSDAPYACRPGQGAPAALPCDNQETRLDKVLARIKVQPADHLAVVVTDLWLTGQDLSAGPSALSGPLSDMLAAGRAVGVAGVRAPYAGPIYDIPNAPSYVGATSHPLFVLLVGPVERVAAFHERLGRLGGGFSGQEAARGGGWSLFTLHPLAPRAAGARPLEVTPGAALAEAPVLPPRAGLDVQQLVLRRGLALRSLARGGDAGSAAFTAHPAVEARPGAVWTGTLAPVVRLWRAKSPAAVCHAGAWTDVGRLPVGWSTDGPAPRFTLKPAEAAAHLPPGGVYLLAASLERPRLETPNPADRWMHDWSFDASSAPAVLARRPAFFPTLNLGETADLLEEALDQASSRAPATAGGFAAVVRVDR